MILDVTGYAFLCVIGTIQEYFAFMQLCSFHVTKQSLGTISTACTLPSLGAVEDQHRLNKVLV